MLYPAGKKLLLSQYGGTCRYVKSVTASVSLVENAVGVVVVPSRYLGYLSVYKITNPRVAGSCLLCGHKAGSLYVSAGGYLCSNCITDTHVCDRCKKVVSSIDVCRAPSGGYVCYTCAKANTEQLQSQPASHIYLDSTLWVAREAANLYLLDKWGLHTGDMAPRNTVARYLAVQFAKYLDIAIFGELRHINKDNFNSWVSAKAQGSSPDFNSPQKYALMQFLQSVETVLRRDQFISFSYGTYASFPTTLRTKVAVELFGCEPLWGGNIGGIKWEKIAKILLAYLSGDTNDVIFVDQVFGLQHNCNFVLDKVYMLHGLSSVLDHNFNGRYKYLLKFASPSVGRLVQWII
jgi:hypothetical protein